MAKIATSQTNSQPDNTLFSIGIDNYGDDISKGVTPIRKMPGCAGVKTTSTFTASTKMTNFTKLLCFLGVSAFALAQPLTAREVVQPGNRQEQHRHVVPAPTINYNPYDDGNATLWQSLISRRFQSFLSGNQPFSSPIPLPLAFTHFCQAVRLPHSTDKPFAFLPLISSTANSIGSIHPLGRPTSPANLNLDGDWSGL